MMRHSGLIPRMTPFMAPIYPSPHPKSVRRVMIDLSAIFFPDALKRFPKRRFQNPFFRYNGAHITVRCNVEGGVTHRDPLRGQTSPPQGGNLRSRALLDGDLCTSLDAPI